MDNEKMTIEEELNYTEEIIDLIHNHLSDADFSTKISEYHPYDISQALLQVEKEDRLKFFNLLKIDDVANIFEHFDDDDAAEFMRELPTSFAVSIIDHMQNDNAVDLLQYLESEEEDTDLVNQLSPKKRNELKKYWSYTEDEIGSLMSSSFIEIPLIMSVKDAMKKVMNVAGETDYISILYILDKQKMVGYMKLKQLIIARSTDAIADVMETRFVSALPKDNKEGVARLMQEYGLSSIPILDEEKHLLGIVTHDVMMDIISEAHSEDYARLAGLGSGDIEEQSESIIASVKSRLPWLAILCFLSMITSLVLSLFEDSLSGSLGALQLSASLAIFLPLILDMSGNTGTQSLAVMIRYLVQNKSEITKAAIQKHLRREIASGVVEGLLIGFLTFLVILISKVIQAGFSLSGIDWIYAVVTAFSIFLALFVSNLFGALIPLLMNKLKFDPAVASGPFITTIADILALVVYYSISLAVLLPLYSNL